MRGERHTGKFLFINVNEKHGFDCVDYGELCDIEKEIFHVEDARFIQRMLEEKRSANDAGIEVYQVHGPWPVDDTTEEKRKENLIHMKRAILGTSLLGSSYIVVHPVMPFGWDVETDAAFSRQINREFLTELTDYARPLGVTVCLENMPFTKCRLSYTDQIVAFLKELNIDNLKICLDTGHANICKEKVGDMVRLCAESLSTLHIHDNGGYTDEHAYPYSRTIDWVDFRKALKEIGFQGCLSLECHSVKEGCPSDIREDMLELLCRIAKSLGYGI